MHGPGREAVTSALFSLSVQRENNRDVLLILVSSGISWVENRMVSQLGEAARDISDVYKVKELEFKFLREYFPMYSFRQCMEVYAVLGGVPGWWEYFDGKCSVKENVCKAILGRTGGLYRAADSLMLEELREPAVYNTILAALAAGMEKLDDLYRHTGFPRAKLSVYLSSLMERNWVEKVFSLEPAETAGKKSSAGSRAKKGIYRICNSYVRFYYTYLFHGEGRLFRMSGERFYNTCILPDRDRYLQDSLRKICLQHIEECGRSGELPVRAERAGGWSGKKDILMWWCRKREEPPCWRFASAAVWEWLMRNTGKCWKRQGRQVSGRIMSGCMRKCLTNASYGKRRERGTLL